jgi:autotransporter family porin
MALALVGVGIWLGVTRTGGGEDTAVVTQPPATDPPAATTAPAEILFNTSITGFDLLEPGSGLPSDEECAARVVRDPWEPVPENYEANHTVGHELRSPQIDVTAEGEALLARIDGNFTGTTDEIIQWASCKWGIDTDPVRAQAFVESEWQQSAVGDNGQSFGITQIKERFHPWAYPGARESTAMNLDYTLALWRLCYEGYVERLPSNARWDKEGCFGWHFSDEWKSPEAQAYVDRIGEALAAHPWWDWPGQAVAEPGATDTTAASGE